MMICATVLMAAWTVVKDTAGSEWGWYYAFLVIGLAVAACVGVSLLLVHALVARSLRWLKWPFLLFVLTAVNFKASPSVTQYLGVTNTITLDIRNASNFHIMQMNVHGRGEHVEILDVAAGADTSVHYRGKNINRTRRNRYENRISVQWFDGDRWRERVVVSEYRVIFDKLVLKFEAPDVLVVSYW